MDKVYSVGQINSYIKHMFINDYALNNLYIKGEVSNCKYHTSGHIYFTLKDSKGTIACVMFAGQRNGLSFKLMDGQSVVAGGSIGVYERDGKYQLYVSEIILDGIGNLYQKYEALKRELDAEGLFLYEYKKSIPKYPKKVGIVTASTGAAIKDIMNISERRNPFVQLILYPALVQGEGAKESIVKGIETLDKLDLDVIIIGRGGGSIEDLWAFNERNVVESIFKCNTPIISAVGHETDTTLSDYVADLRAPTPSAAAELAVTDINDLLGIIDEYKFKLYVNINGQINYLKMNIEALTLRLEHLSPTYQIKEKRQYLIDMEDRIIRAMDMVIKNKKHMLAIYAERLSGLSPLTKMCQGYSLVTNKDDNVINSIENIHEGDNIHVHMKDGHVRAVVQEIDEVRRN